MKEEHEKFFRETAQVLSGGASADRIYNILVSVYGIGEGVGVVKGLATARATDESVKRELSNLD